MSTTIPSRLEAMAVCKQHMSYYRQQAELATSQRKYGIAVSARANAEAIQRLMDVLTGKLPPLGTRGEK